MTDGTLPPAALQRASAQPLAARADCRLGDLTIRPSLLSIEGPGGAAKGEPRVIRVLVALADADGAVLSRDALLETCWDGIIVGDDAINRAIGELRRLIAGVGSRVEVQTIPRVGYRLSVGNAAVAEEAPAAGGARQRLSRRNALILGGGLLAAAGVGGAAWYSAWRKAGETDALVEQGRLLQASGEPSANTRAAALFRRAVALDPKRADAWGWLAAVTVGNEGSLAAANHALALDPREPNARAVVASERRGLDDWITYEDALLGIVRDAPRCTLALAELTLFYQGMGRCRDSLAFNERAIAVEPFSPWHQSRRAMKHWIFGDIATCDRVANRAMELWPGNPTVWNARMITLAFTGRPLAAKALLNDRARAPANLSRSTAAAWEATLAAIASRAQVARAIPPILAAATDTPGMAANAVMAFSYLELLDEAYEVADGLLAQSGTIVQRSHGSLTRDLYAGPVWGRTQFLFVPACANLRADSRFTDLCRRTGHIAYWHQRGIGPDPFVRGSLKL